MAQVRYIVRYDATAIHAGIKSKVKPEPWLHVAVNADGQFAIYIWDTRQVLDTGKVDSLTFHNLAKANKAKDNRQPLVGTSAKDFDFSKPAKTPKSFDPYKAGKQEPLQIKSAQHFKELLKNGDWKLPHVKKGIMQFIKDMDAKYGKDGHGYRHDFELAKRGIIRS